MAQKNAFTIRIDGLDKLEKAFDQSPQTTEMFLRQAMRVSTSRVKTEMREQIRREGITNTGNLARNIYIEEPTKPTYGRVYVGEKYGAVVEFGRRPGSFPPVAPLERWAQTKLGKGGIGFLIARKIAREGTKAHPFVGPTFDKTVEPITREMADAIKRILQKVAQ